MDARAHLTLIRCSTRERYSLMLQCFGVAIQTTRICSYKRRFPTGRLRDRAYGVCVCLLATHRALGVFKLCGERFSIDRACLELRVGAPEYELYVLEEVAGGNKSLAAEVLAMYPPLHDVCAP